MAYENLPGAFTNLIDGNLIVGASNENPAVLVIGTSPRGDAENLYEVSSVSEAAQAFGKDDGTLVRGMYEAVAGGAQNVKLYRIGATSSTVTTIGGGITVETLSKDSTAGTDYNIFWDDSAERLRIWRASNDLLVYDNYPAYPSGAVDENEVSVTGAVVGVAGSGSRADIGTLAAPVTLAGSSGIGGAVYTAGTDGIDLSRMELFEELFKAYKLLENGDADIICPMNAFLDDANIADMTSAEITALNSSTWSGQNSYPTPGSSSDALAKVFAQEYLGEWYFWWDTNADGVAEIWPNAGSANQVLDTAGVALTAGDFHEANFGYQLADFCYRQSENNQEMTGVIGMLPPTSWSLKDVSAWVGTAPTETEDTSGNSIVTANGTGLLGNKWMAGRMDSGTVPGHIVNGISGFGGGGFIATDDGWPDGTEQSDRNDHLIDIGKYMSVVAAQAILANSTNSTSYVATGAAAYAGMYSKLPANSAPTNKVISGVRLPFRVSVAKLDDLAGKRYVMFQQKSKGVVVADAPTSARTDSDYRRLTTMRIVKATIDSIRSVSEPFLGEAITGARLAALETAIDGVLAGLQKLEYLQRSDAVVTSTPTQQINGQATVELVLVPAFELRQITINVALSAQ
jgi:hypothetical protein